MINSRFKFREILNYELRTICKDIKKKPDYNSINIKMILDNLNTIGRRLTIINEFMETGICSKNWKMSMITPMEKVSRANKCKEGRLISSLKLSGKNCKKKLHNILQIIFYLNINLGLEKNFHAKPR